MIIVPTFETEVKKQNSQHNKLKFEVSRPGIRKIFNMGDQSDDTKDNIKTVTNKHVESTSQKLKDVELISSKPSSTLIETLCSEQNVFKRR